MVCPHCNTQLEDDAKFCKECGAPVQNPAEQKQAPAEPLPPEKMHSRLYENIPQPSPIEVKTSAPTQVSKNPSAAKAKKKKGSAGKIIAALSVMLVLSLAALVLVLRGNLQNPFQNTSSLPITSEAASSDAPASPEPENEVVVDAPETPAAEEKPGPPEGASAFTGFESPYVYKGMEVVFHDDISFITMDIELSDYYGEQIIRIPVTLTNISGETLNPPHHVSLTAFGPDGLEIRMFEGDEEDSLYRIPQMRDGATQEMGVYILYVGPGEYCIEPSFLDIELLFTVK